MWTRQEIDRIDVAATRWADRKMGRCPICKADIGDGHKHTAAEAKRYLKKANQRSPIPGKNYPRRDKILGGQNFRRSEQPCGECHLKPGEVCDICGKRASIKERGV